MNFKYFQALQGPVRTLQDRMAEAQSFSFSSRIVSLSLISNLNYNHDDSFHELLLIYIILFK